MSQLDYLKLQSRKFYTYTKSQKPLKEEMMEYLLAFRKMIKTRGLEFRTKIVEGLPDSTNVCLDWRVYKSILYHILSNAIKFCNAKGNIGLEMVYRDFDENEV
jgi:signal transduction histidine kinase